MTGVSRQATLRVAMRFVCYDSWESLPEDTSALFEESEKRSVFSSLAWFLTLYEFGYDQEQPLLLAAVEQDGSLLALLPLLSHGRMHYQSFDHRYTGLVSPLISSDRREDVTRCLVDGLQRMPLSSLQLRPIDDDDEVLRCFQEAMEADGYSTQKHFKFYNWIHRTQGESFEDYLAKRPSKLRNTIARKQRRLERERQSEIIMFRGKKVAKALDDYHATYSASWKAYEQYRPLLDALAINLSVPDWTRLAVLYIDGEAAAAQLWFVVHGKASIFRLAYDEKWKPYSPGSILTAWLMRYVIDDDQVEEIDFLVGNEQYKQEWMTERRQRYSLTFVSQGDRDKKRNSILTRMVGWLQIK